MAICNIWLQVLLNGERLPIKNFMEYVDLYLPDKSVPRIHEKVNDRWEVIVAATTGQFQQVCSPFSLCYSYPDLVIQGKLRTQMHKLSILPYGCTSLEIYVPLQGRQTKTDHQEKLHSMIIKRDLEPKLHCISYIFLLCSLNSFAAGQLCELHLHDKRRDPCQLSGWPNYKVRSQPNSISFTRGHMYLYCQTVHVLSIICMLHQGFSTCLNWPMMLQCEHTSQRIICGHSAGALWSRWRRARNTKRPQSSHSWSRTTCRCLSTAW